MDLLNETRTLIHTGKLLRQPETGFEWSGWTELFVLLFDNYSEFCHVGALIRPHQSPVVMTKTKERDGVIKYHVNKRVRTLTPAGHFLLNLIIANPT